VVELAFETRQLRAICESEAHARRELGADVAAALQRRLSDLLAAASPNDIGVGAPRQLDGTDPRPRMIIDLRDGFQLVLGVNHRKIPTTQSGSVDWSRVTRFKVLAIGRDYA
jgi:proteic killer suppression protein